MFFIHTKFSLKDKIILSLHNFSLWTLFKLYIFGTRASFSTMEFCHYFTFSIVDISLRKYLNFTQFLLKTF